MSLYISEDEYADVFRDDFTDIDFENVPGMQAITSANDIEGERAVHERPHSSRASSVYEDFPEATSSFIRELDELENRLTRAESSGSHCESPIACYRAA
jgi:hypothetical protein